MLYLWTEESLCLIAWHRPKLTIFRWSCRAEGSILNLYISGIALAVSVLLKHRLEADNGRRFVTISTSFLKGAYSFAAASCVIELLPTLINGWV